MNFFITIIIIIIIIIITIYLFILVKLQVLKGEGITNFKFKTVFLHSTYQFFLTNPIMSAVLLFIGNCHVKTIFLFKFIS